MSSYTNSHASSRTLPLVEDLRIPSTLHLGQHSADRATYFHGLRYSIRLGSELILNIGPSRSKDTERRLTVHACRVDSLSLLHEKWRSFDQVTTLLGLGQPTVVSADGCVEGFQS